MSAAGSNRVNVVHRKLTGLAVARRGSSERTTSGQPANAGMRGDPLRGAPDPRRRAARRRRGSRRRRRADRRCPTGRAGAAAELPRQVANGIAEAQPHALRSLVHLRPRVVERVHREVGEDVEVGLGMRPLQHVLEGGAEVEQVHRPVGEEQELGEGQLPLAQDPERAGHRLAAVALLHDRGGQRVIARSRRTTTGARRPASPAGTAATGAPAGSRRCRSPPGAACRRRSRDRSRRGGARRRRSRTPGSRAGASSSRSGRRTGLRGGATPGGTLPTRANSASAINGCGPGPAMVDSFRPATSEASISSGTFSGSGAMAASISAGGPPRKTVTGRASPRASGHRVVEPAALADLPVHAGGVRAVDLHAVEAEVVPLALRVLGVDQGQGQERPAVLGPARDDRKLLQAHVPRHDLADGAGRPPRRADAQELADEVALLPHHPEVRRGGPLRELGHPADELEGPAAKGLLHAPAGAEEVA